MAHSGGPRLLVLSFCGLFHPILVLLTVMLAAGAKGQVNPALSVAVCLLSAAVPGAYYKLLPRFRNEQGSPTRRLIAITVWNAALMACLVVLRMPANFIASLGGLTAGTALLAVGRRHINASAHVAVLTLGICWWIVSFGTSYAWLLVLSPLMMLSRIKIGAHSASETIIGFIVGLASFGAFLGISAGGY